MNRDKSKDAARKAIIAEHHALERLQYKQDLSEVLKTNAGQRMVWHLMRSCRVFESTFTGNSEGMFLEGKRKVGLELMADMQEVDPDFMPRILKKDAESQRELRQRLEKA